MKTPLRLRKAAAAVALSLTMLMTAAPAFAISIVPSCAQEQKGKAADLNCVLLTFENIANLILGVTGSFALLMFIYGGFMMLSSGGAEEKITKGKTAIRNAVIGIVIILLSGYIVRYATSTLRGPGSLVQSSGQCTQQGGGTAKSYQVDGKTVCASTCAEISGYSCTTQTAGKTCLVGLCSATGSDRCCPNN